MIKKTTKIPTRFIYCYIFKNALHYFSEWTNQNRGNNEKLKTVRVIGFLRKIKIHGLNSVKIIFLFLTPFFIIIIF